MTCLAVVFWLPAVGVVTAELTEQHTRAALPGRHLATGSFDGRLQTWDLECPEQPVYDAIAHQGHREWHRRLRRPGASGMHIAPMICVGTGRN